jgi:hypothetical protein
VTLTTDATFDLQQQEYVSRVVVPSLQVFFDIFWQRLFQKNMTWRFHFHVDQNQAILE